MKQLINPRALSTARQQRGMTLIIALVMLTVLTMIGVTISNMATVDLKIVNNQQAGQRARMAAESGIDYLMNNTAQLELMAPFSFAANPTEPSATFAIPVPAGSNWSASVVVNRMGDPLPCPKATLPISAASIDSTTIANCVYFEMISTGTENRNATATLTRGFYRKVGGYVAGT